MEVRKYVTIVEEILEEGGRSMDRAKASGKASG